MQAIDLPLSGISPDDAFAITYPSRPERYEGTEEKFPGLPLLVIDGTRRIVCGHDLIPLLRQRGDTRARALQVEPTLADGLLLNFNVLDRLFGLNLAEKLLFLKKALPLLPVGEIQRRACLGFPIHGELRCRLDVLLSSSFRPVLAAGRLAMRTALKLAGQEAADREAQLRVFQAFGFSEGQQRQVVELLEEIAFREKMPVAAVLAAGNLLALLDGEMPQQRFMEALSARRYPEQSRMEKEWLAWRKKAAVDEGVALSHAPFFASEEVQVTLTVKNRSAAGELLRRLKKTDAH